MNDQQNHVDIPYLDLWKRLDRVVTEFTRLGDPKTADYLMVGFFLRYAEPAQLQKFVEIAEESLQEALRTGN